MKLRDILNKFTNSSWLLTINGVCDEWYGGVEELKEEDYYKKYRDKKVLSMAILSTNEVPELIITIEN